MDKIIQFLFAIFGMCEAAKFGITVPIEPLHYSLYLKPEFTKLRSSFSGHVTIHFRANMTSQFQYHHHVTYAHMRYNVRVTSTTLCQDAVCHLAEVTDTSYDYQTELETLTFDKVLDGEYQINMTFVGMLGISQGLKRAYTGDYPQLVSHFKPEYARQVFPCIDQPDKKATFQLTLVHEADYTALSNTPLLSSTVEGEWVEDVFEVTPKMSTYLLALALVKGHTVAWRTLDSGTDVSLWLVTMEDDVLEEFPVFTSLGPMLEYMENYTGIAYPLPKYDNVAFDNYNFASSAMENFGLVTWEDMSVYSRYCGPLVSAHEIAHQWLGNLVTVRDWTFTWFQEGGAHFLAQLITENTLDKETLDTMVNCNNYALTTPMKLDAGGKAKALVFPREQQSGLYDYFNSHVYSKGGAVYRMLYGVLGKDKFRRMWRHILNKYEYSNIDYDQFLDEVSQLEQQDGDKNGDHFNVGNFLLTWLQQPGVPVVTVRKEGFRLRLSQSRLDIRGTRVEALPAHQWLIPVKVNVNGIPVERIFWIENGTTSYQLYSPVQVRSDRSEGLILADMDFEAYYYINYDPENWKRIGLQLQGNVSSLSERYRHKLWRDLYYLSQAGEVNALSAANMLPALQNERSKKTINFALPLLKTLVLAFGDLPQFNARIKSLTRGLNLHWDRFHRKQVWCRIEPMSEFCRDKVITQQFLQSANNATITTTLKGLYWSFPTREAKLWIFEHLTRNVGLRSELLRGDRLVSLAGETYDSRVLVILEVWGAQVEGEELEKVEAMVHVVARNVRWREQAVPAIRSWLG